MTDDNEQKSIVTKSDIVRALMQSAASGGDKKAQKFLQKKFKEDFTEGVMQRMDKEKNGKDKGTQIE